MFVSQNCVALGCFLKEANLTWAYWFLLDPHVTFLSIKLPRYLIERYDIKTIKFVETS